MQEPGRKYTATSSNYRYGYNGKELDKDLGGGAYDYGLRIYDQRLGRFLSVDPISAEYPELTPFQYASNRPIDGVDLDGLEYANYSYNPSSIKTIRESEAKEIGARTEMDVKRDASAKVNVIPVLGDVKGFIETFTGKDLMSGDKLSAGDRVLGLFLLSEARTLKSLKAVDKLKDAEKAVEAANKIDKVVATEKAIVKNKKAGDLREIKEEGILRNNHPGADVQNQQYLRDAEGKIVKDPLTNEARRIDHIVIKDGKALDAVETTSRTANKVGQTAKENRIREAGGTFVRDRTTKKLVDIKDIPTRISRHE